MNGQIGGDYGEDALGITNRNGAGDHPYLTASRIKIRVRPDARVCGQWRREPGLRLDAVGRHGKIQGDVAVGSAIDVGAGGDPSVVIQQRRGAAVERGVGIQVGPQTFRIRGRMWVARPPTPPPRHRGRGCRASWVGALVLQARVVTKAIRSSEAILALKAPARATTRVAPTMRTSQGNHKGCPYNAHQPGQPQGLPLQCPPARATTRVAPTMRTTWGNHKGCPYNARQPGQPQGLPLQCAPARATTRVAPTMRTTWGNHKGCPYFVTIVTAFAPQLRLAEMRLPCMEVDSRPRLRGGDVPSRG